MGADGKVEKMNLRKTLSFLALCFALLLVGCDSSNVAPNHAAPPSNPIDSGDSPTETADTTPSNPESIAQERSPILANECVNLALSSPAIDIGAGLPNGFEPSGADWHPRLRKIFSVHDNGYLFSMDKEGGDVRTWNVGGDLEGVTLANPESDFVYIGREYPAAILEFNIETGRVTRTFPLGGANKMPENSSQGLEALTFVEIQNHPEGGQFWAGHQGNGQIYVFELPIVSSSVSTNASLQVILQPVPGRNDIAGMDYSPEFDVVYIIYDASNRLSIVDPDNGSVYFDRSLPQTDQEGIAVNNLCDLFLAQDTNKKFWHYRGRDEILINKDAAKRLADRLVEVQNNDGSYDWKQMPGDPLSPETTGYQNVTGVSVWGFFNAILLLEDESYQTAIENSVNYFNSRIDDLLSDPHNPQKNLSCPNYSVFSRYLQRHPDPLLENRAIDAFNSTLNARDNDYGSSANGRADGLFNYLIARRASIAGIIPWDMALCVEAFMEMAQISSDFEEDYQQSLALLAAYLESQFLPTYDSDPEMSYGDISLSMPLFALGGRNFSNTYADLIHGLTLRLENLIDENGLITNGSENSDGLEQPSAYGLMALKQVHSARAQSVQEFLESRIDEQGRIIDLETGEETYEVEGEVLRAIAKQ